MADWTTVNPTIVAGTKLITPSGTEIELEFTDDTTPTPNTFIRKFRVKDLADLQRQAYQYQIQLSNTDDVPTTGSVTPVAPTPVEAAITDMQEAVRRKTALLDYQTLMGLTGTDNIGVSTITINQALATLDTDIDENVNNATNINRMLDNWPR